VGAIPALKVMKMAAEITILKFDFLTYYDRE
jgi:hypothetical protein